MCIRQAVHSLLLAALLCLTISTSASALDHCWVPHGQTYTINEHSTCRRVTNNHASGVQIFVPTKTAAEWSTGGNAFMNATPAGVTISACGVCGDTANCGPSAGGSNGISNNVWVPVGSSVTLPSITTSGRYNLAQMSSSMIVAEGEPTATDIQAYQFNGTTWAGVGTSATLSGDNFRAAVKITATDYVFVEEEEASGEANDDIRLHARRWTGSGWSASLSNQNTGIADAPKASKLNATAIAVIGDYENAMEAWNWNGSAWTELGKIDYPQSGTRYQLRGVAYLSDNSILVHEQYFVDSLTPGNYFLTPYTWNGTTFVAGTRHQIGTVASPVALQNMISLTPTSVISSLNVGGDHRLVVHYWNGSTWTATAQQSFGTIPISFEKLDFNEIAIVQGTVGGTYTLRKYISGCF